MRSRVMAKKQRVLIVEDDPMMQAGIASLIEKHTDLEVAQIASNGLAGVNQALEIKPKIVIMDIALPKLNGIEATRRIKSALPKTKVVMLTHIREQQQALEAFASGADAYCIKGSSIDSITNALNTVKEDSESVYLDGKIANLLLRKPSAISQIQSNVEGFNLSDREIKILEKIAEGKSNNEIAKELNLSRHTIKSNLRHIFVKLGVTNRIEAVFKATDSGMLNESGM